MEFTLIVCTYQRPQPLLKLLNSVVDQTKYPDQILIIDGSPDTRTEEILQKNYFRNLGYYKVPEEERGLTRQRNYGIKKVANSSEIVCFLDDDIVLTPTYFENLLKTYSEFPDAIGVGGFIIDEAKWEKVNENILKNPSEFVIDGYFRPDSSRFLLRKKFGLMPKTFPTFMPKGGHGRSVGFLPPSGKIYHVETFMGGVSSFRKDIFHKITYSKFFAGYGLYEDTDFTLRLSKIGNLYLNTSAKVYHHHDQGGRPNKFLFGKMVVINGWYVWRVKYTKPDFPSRIKWHLTTGLLILVRLSNIFNTPMKKQAFLESMGRIWGWLCLIFYNPGEKRL